MKYSINSVLGGSQTATPGENGKAIEEATGGSIRKDQPEREVPARDAAADLFCPNCGARLQGLKCKLLCPTAACGYRVTCSEW